MSFDRDANETTFLDFTIKGTPSEGDEVPLYVRGWCIENCDTYGECGWLKKNCPYYTTPQWKQETPSSGTIKSVEEHE